MKFYLTKKRITIITFIIMFSVVSKYFSFRLDMTEDKKFSLEKPLIFFLKSLKKNIKIDIYLDGDLPLELLKLKNFIEQKLVDFRNISKFIDYRFVNIKKLDNKAKKKIFKKLKKRKIYANNFFVKKKGEKQQITIYPIIRIKSDNKEIFTKIVHFDNKKSLIENIRIAEQKLESRLIENIYKSTIEIKKKIAIVRQNHNPDKNKFYSIFLRLKDFYKISFVDLSLDSLDNYDVILLVSQIAMFSEQEKYKIDQYLMSGGKILFFINLLNVNYKNLQQGHYFVINKDLGIRNMLCKYGIRVNSDIIQDFQCMNHPIVISAKNEKTNIEWIKWPYYPKITNFGNHIICNNIKQISTRFISSLNKINIEGLKHIPLLYTSNLTKRQFAPFKINLEDLKILHKKNGFSNTKFVISYLIEGYFKSFFKDTFFLKQHNHNLKKKSPYTKIIVVSDNKLILNDINPQNKKYIPLGYDFYSNQKFDQETFIFNCVNYLAEDTILMKLKKKKISLHLLNIEKIKNHYRKFQIINLTLPIIFLLILGFLWNYFYKKKYKI